MEFLGQNRVAKESLAVGDNTDFFKNYAALKAFQYRDDQKDNPLLHIVHAPQNKEGILEEIIHKIEESHPGAAPWQIDMMVRSALAGASNGDFSADDVAAIAGQVAADPGISLASYDPMDSSSLYATTGYNSSSSIDWSSTDTPAGDNAAWNSWKDVYSASTFNYNGMPSIMVGGTAKDLRTVYDVVKTAHKHFGGDHKATAASIALGLSRGKGAIVNGQTVNPTQDEIDRAIDQVKKERQQETKAAPPGSDKVSDASKPGLAPEMALAGAKLSEGTDGTSKAYFHHVMSIVTDKAMHATENGTGGAEDRVVTRKLKDDLTEGALAKLKDSQKLAVDKPLDPAHQHAPAPKQSGAKLQMNTP